MLDSQSWSNLPREKVDLASNAEQGWCGVNTPDGCFEGCSFEQNSLDISSH